MLRTPSKLLAATAVLALGLAAAPPALAIDAAITIWKPTTLGDDPNMTEIDVAGITGHVDAAPDVLTIATVYENMLCPGGPCGVTYWNPVTNMFRCYGYSSGAMTGIDIDRTSPGLVAPDGTTYGPGDTWLFKSTGRSLTVQFPGSDIMRHWEAGNLSSGTIDQSTGLVWVTDQNGFIGRFNPADNVLTRWTVGGRPRDIVLDSTGRAYATVPGVPDQIVRVDATINEVRRWSVPGGGFRGAFAPASENPDGIDVDLDGRIWFAETSSDEIGRLDPVANIICEMRKTGLLNPQNISTSGSGLLQQTYFSELNGNAAPAGDPASAGAIGVLTSSEADLAGPGTQVCTGVAPAVSTVIPTTVTLAPSTVLHSARLEHVPPVTTIVDGVDGVPGSGAVETADGEVIPSILRFPIPALSSGPVGMTRVAVAGTVFGSLIGTEDLFRLTSEVVVAPPGGDPCEPGPGFIDDDLDGICDLVDVCLGSVVDDPIRLGTNRFANIVFGGDPDFFETNRKGRANKSFTTEETQGCTCQQIVDKLPLNDEEIEKLAAGGTLREGHENFGCSSSIIEDWLAFLEEDGADGLVEEVAFTEEFAICSEEIALK